MATFTHLDERDVATIAAAAGLGTIDQVTAIAAGTVNSNFQFRVGRDLWFVRVNEGKTADDVAWEADLVIAIADAGVPTPVPRLVDGRRWIEHRGLLVSVFPWIDGSLRAANEVSSADARTLGGALARFHHAARSRWPHCSRTGIYQWPRIVERFHQVVAASRPELSDAVALLGETIASLDGAQAVRASASHSIIHGDLFRDNVLWHGGDVAALLDFEQAAHGSVAYDVAVAVNDWCWDQSIRPELAAALLAGHQEQWAWTVADRDAFAYELIAAAVRFTVTRLTDVYLRQVDNPDKHYGAFLSRVAFWRSSPGAELSANLVR